VEITKKTLLPVIILIRMKDRLTHLLAHIIN
jgi:hypothetical protein